MGAIKTTKENEKEQERGELRLFVIWPFARVHRIAVHKTPAVLLPSDRLNKQKRARNSKEKRPKTR